MACFGLLPLLKRVGGRALGYHLGGPNGRRHRVECCKPHIEVNCVKVSLTCTGFPIIREASSDLYTSATETRLASILGRQVTTIRRI